MQIREINLCIGKHTTWYDTFSGYKNLTWKNNKIYSICFPIIHGRVRYNCRQLTRAVIKKRRIRYSPFFVLRMPPNIQSTWLLLKYQI